MEVRTKAICHLDDWLTTPEMPFFSKLTGNGDMYLHDHTFFEIFYMTDGTIGHEINGKTEMLHAGDLRFLFPQDKHLFFREKSNLCRHRDIVMRTEFFRSLCDFVSETLYRDFSDGKTQKGFNLPFDKIREYEEIFNKITTLTALHNDDAALSLAKVACTQILGLLLTGAPTDKGNKTDWLDFLLTRMNDPEYTSQGLDVILSPISYSREYICRIFKSKTGKTLTEYLNEQRLLQAAEKLAYTNDSTLSISMDLGFSSLSYFNSIFKKKYKCTPSDFRRTVRIPPP